MSAAAGGVAGGGIAVGGGGGGGGGGGQGIGLLKALALKAVVLDPKRALTAAAVERANAILPRDKEGRQYVKQGVIDALSKDNRLVDDTLPLFFFEADQRRLSFKGAAKITEALLAAVCPAVHALEYLDLSGCFLLGDSSIPVALTACPGLRSLKLEGCRKMTDAALGHVVELGRALQAVSVGGCFNMTEAGLLQLVTEHPNRQNFKELYLSGLPFGPQLLEALCANCPKLRHVGLGYSDVAVTEESLLSLLRRLRLRKLHVPWCQVGVTDRVLEVIAEECPELEELNICGCKKVTPPAIEQLLVRRNPPHSDATDSSRDQHPLHQSGDNNNDHVLPASPSKRPKGNGGAGAKRMRRLKLRYATTSRTQVKAIEEAWGGNKHGVEFPH